MKKIVIVLSLFFVFTSCQQNTKKDTIKIATLKGPSAMGMVKMIDSLNLLTNPGIEIKVHNEPIQVRKFMLENEVDLAVVPTTMGAILYNKELPYKIAAVPVWGTLYLFGQDTTIQSWDDLRGKRVHVMAKGMTPDVLFKHLLLKNGINPDKDITLDYSFPTHIDLANAVAAGQAKLGVISEPLVSLVMQKNSAVHPLFDLNKEWQKVHEKTPIAQTALMVNSDFALNHAKELQKILNSYRHSSDWVNNNQKEAANLIVQYDILPNKEVAFQSIPRSNLDFKEAKDIIPQINAYLQVFYELNADIIGGTIPDDNFYLK